MIWSRLCGNSRTVGASLEMSSHEKKSLLERRLQDLGSVLVAYSGGVDSAFLAWMAHKVHGERMLAVLADSPSLARSQMRDAVAFAEEHGIRLEIVRTEEMEDPDYVRNDSARCFHCKDELFRVMELRNRVLGFQHVAYGMNVDDRGDFRPGQRAAALHNVVAPLVDAGFGKQEIREMARELGLRVWDKPASACLSSRIEYGRPVTREALTAVEQGEEALRELGFRQFRVRHHGEIARIEIAREEMERALTLNMMSALVAIFKALGFKYVTLDCEGFRSGSMNAVLPASAIAPAGFHLR
jgi:uncharacterized protein